MSSSEAPTVLIVEDDMNLRVVCEMTLVSGGYNFHSVDGTLQAIACLNEGQSFDLILTDFKIPGQIDGQTFINEVRLMGIHTPAIITSGYEFDDSSLPNGTCFLAKPYTLRSLLDLVKDCLNKNGDDVG